MLHRAHHEGKARRLLLDLLEQRALIGAEQAQVVGAAALHEAQIARVIDDAGKVGVLVIDPDRLEMPAVADVAVECGGVHRHGTFFCIAASQWRPSKYFGVMREVSKSSRQRALTSILSGSERGT